MGFSVDVDGLQALPAQLDRLGTDVGAGSTYIHTYAKMSYGGVLDRIIGGHQGVVDEATGFFDKVNHNVAYTSAQAIREAVTSYRTSDRNAASRLDASYPRVDVDDPAAPRPGMSAQGWVQGASFSDVCDPRDRYRAPDDYSGEYPLEPQQLLTLSISGNARHLIMAATGTAAQLGFGHTWDPYAAILKPLTGDWAGLRGCKDVFDNAADACEDMSRNVANGVLSIDTVWQGNAADSARNHLHAIAEALEASAEPMRSLGEAYETAAEGAHALFGTLADMVDDLVDAVIVFIGAATSAAATSETVVGGLGFGAVAGYEAWSMYELINGLIECASTANALMETLNSQQSNFGVVQSNVKLPDLPGDRPKLPGNQAAVYYPTITSTTGTGPTTGSTVSPPAGTVLSSSPSGH